MPPVVDGVPGTANPLSRLTNALDRLIRDKLADALIGSGDRTRRLSPAAIDWLTPAFRGVLLGWVAGRLVDAVLGVDGLGALTFFAIVFLSLRRKLAGLLPR